MFPTSRSRELGIPRSRITRRLRRSQEQRGRSRRTPLLEPLETRTLLSQTLPWPGGVPAVTSGTATDSGNSDNSSHSSHSVTDLPVAAQYVISAAIGKDSPDYYAAASGTGWTLANPTNHFSIDVQPDVLNLSAGADHWEMALRQVGYGEATQPVAAARVQASANRVSYDYGLINEWFVNGPLGLQQGFTLPQRPALEPGPSAGDGPAPSRSSWGWAAT